MELSSSSILNFDQNQLKPLREKIASVIRDSIIMGKLKSGAKLAEPEVAASLGVSRTPLREAFLQLESEGFLTVSPRKGAIVSELSLKDAQETFVIKGTLEALAARLAIPNLTKEKISSLIELNDKMDDIAQSNSKDYESFLDLNGQFHQIISDSCGNEKLTKYITVFRNQTLRYNFIYHALSSHLGDSVKEHKSIIGAIQQANYDEVENLLKSHGEHARSALSNLLTDIDKTGK